MNIFNLLAAEVVSIVDKNAALAVYCRGFVISVLALLLMALAFTAGADFGRSMLGGVHKTAKLVEVACIVFVCIAVIIGLITIALFILICWKTL